MMKKEQTFYEVKFDYEKGFFHTFTSLKKKPILDAYFWFLKGSSPMLNYEYDGGMKIIVRKYIIGVEVKSFLGYVKKEG